jgi:hypothetical protein
LLATIEGQMNLAFLGDAHDHWKGAVLWYLQKENVLRNFSVDPMATDDSQWKEADSKLYARLLRIEERQLVRHKRTLREDRKDRNLYFSQIPQTGDLFLDPDTGIFTSGSKREKYLLSKELFEILESESDRLVVVYQHSARNGKMRERVKQVLGRLKEQKSPFSCSSYESNTAALLFFSRTGCPCRSRLATEVVSRRATT